jgi:endonuclease YncB( thermonuclease family)
MVVDDLRPAHNENLVITFVVCLACSLAEASDLSGVPRVVDGDTLAIGSTEVRLEGIDAPETNQICLNANGVRWICGIDARDHARAITNTVTHILARTKSDVCYRICYRTR